MFTEHYYYNTGLDGVSQKIRIEDKSSKKKSRNRFDQFKVFPALTLGTMV